MNAMKLVEWNIKELGRNLGRNLREPRKERMEERCKESLEETKIKLEVLPVSTISSITLSSLFLSNSLLFHFQFLTRFISIPFPVPSHHIPFSLINSFPSYCFPSSFLFSSNCLSRCFLVHSPYHKISYLQKMPQRILLA